MSNNVNGPGGIPGWNAWHAGQTAELVGVEGGSQSQSTQPTGSLLVVGLAQLNQQQAGSQGMMGAFLDPNYDPFANSRQQIAEQDKKFLRDLKSEIKAVEKEVPLKDINLTDLNGIMKLIESKVEKTPYTDHSEIVQLRLMYGGEYTRRLREQAEQQKHMTEGGQGKDAIDDAFDWDDTGSRSSFGNESD